MLDWNGGRSTAAAAAVEQGATDMSQSTNLPLDTKSAPNDNSNCDSNESSNDSNNNSDSNNTTLPRRVIDIELARAQVQDEAIRALFESVVDQSTTRTSQLKHNLELLNSAETERLSTERSIFDTLTASFVVTKDQQHSNDRPKANDTLLKSLSAQCPPANYCEPLNSPQFYAQNLLVPPSNVLITSSSSSPSNQKNQPTELEATKPSKAKTFKFSSLAPRRRAVLDDGDGFETEQTDHSKAKNTCRNQTALSQNSAQVPPSLTKPAWTEKDLEETKQFIKECGKNLPLLNGPELFTLKTATDALSAQVNNLHENLHDTHFLTDKTGQTMFSVEPSVVTFHDFCVGGGAQVEYVRVRNLTQHTRRLRLVLDRLKQSNEKSDFDIELCESVGDFGQVPSGLACTFQITFQPSTYRPQKRTITIQSDSGHVFAINIQSAPQRPNFHTTNQIITLDACREGYDSTCCVELENIGDDGFVRVIDAANVDSYFAEGKSIVRPTQPENNELPNEFKSGIMLMKPSVFHVRKHLKAELTFIVSAPRISTPAQGFKHKLAFIYDNYDVEYVEVVVCVQKICFQVEQLSDERNSTNAHVDIPYALSFPNTLMNQTITKTVTVKNYSNIGFRFLSQFQNCHADNPTNQCDAFTMDPQAGVFEPLGKIKFTMKFKSTYTGTFENIVQFVVPFDESQSDTVDLMRVHGQCIKCPLQFSPFVPSFPSFIGFGKEIKVPLFIKNTFTKPIRARVEHENIIGNDSLTIKLATGSDNEIKIGAQEQKDSSLLIKADTRGTFAGLLSIVTENGSKFSFDYEFCVDFELNSITVEPSLVDFGCIPVGEQRETKIRITNCSQFDLICKSCLVGNEEDNSPISIPSIECFELAAGKSIESLVHLNACSVGSFKSHCILSVAQSMENKFDPIAGFKVHADVEEPKLDLDVTEYDFGTTYLNVKSQPAIVKLRNPTRVLSLFEWNHDPSNDLVSVEFSPRVGEVAPMSDQIVQIKITPKIVGELNYIPLQCTLKSATNSNGNLTKMTVIGKSVSSTFSYNLTVDSNVYTEIEDSITKKVSTTCKCIPNEDGAGTILDFGMDCPIFARRSRTLLIKNTSGIEKKYRLDFEKFKSTYVPEKTKSSGQQAQIDVEHLLQRGVRVGFKSRSGQEYAEIKTNSRVFLMENVVHLGLNNGMAFFTEDLHTDWRTLQPFESVEIKVCAVNNMWGKFEDELIVTFMDEEPLRVPVRIGIRGSPLQFIEFPNLSDSTSCMKLSTALVYPQGKIREYSDGEGNPIYMTETHKTIHAVNLSPKIVHVRWDLNLLEDEKKLRCFISTDTLMTDNRLKLLLSYSEMKRFTSGFPFKVEPEQSVLSPGQTVSIRIRLKSPIEGHFIGTLVGYLGHRDTIDSRIQWSERIPQQSILDHVYESSQVKLNLNGTVIVPRLELANEKQQIVIKCRHIAESSNPTSTDYIWNRTIALTQKCPIPVKFQLSIGYQPGVEPVDVKIKEVAQSSYTENAEWTLSPNSNIHINMMITSKSRQQGRIASHLKISFSNEVEQKIPLIIEFQ